MPHHPPHRSSATFTSDSGHRKSEGERSRTATPPLIRACDGCGTLAYADDLYCSCCGTQLWTQRHCRHCNAPIRHPLAIHCTHCGETLDSGERTENGG